MLFAYFLLRAIFSEQFQAMFRMIGYGNYQLIVGVGRYAAARPSSRPLARPTHASRQRFDATPQRLSVYTATPRSSRSFGPRLSRKRLGLALNLGLYNW